MIIDKPLLDELSARALESERLRMNYNLHESLDAKAQRLLNALEPENHFVASRVAPPTLRTWSYDMDIVVFGHGDEQYESGGHEVYPSRINRRPHKGYPIPTIGKSLEEISSGIDTFISYAAAHPELRFHVRKVGYDKAGYSVDQIAPLFARAKELKNVLLPQAVVTALGW